jgi:hypothetical protein
LVLGGQSTTTPFTVADGNTRTIIYTPETTSGCFGSATAGVGDVNKDTFDDFVICAKLFSATTVAGVGACYVIYGGNNTIHLYDQFRKWWDSNCTTASQTLGSCLAGVGDINKDGYADILISGGDKKNVYLLYGGPSLTNVDATPGSFPGVIFPNPGSTIIQFGWSVSGAGDFNGDGF